MNIESVVEDIAKTLYARSSRTPLRDMNWNRVPTLVRTVWIEQATALILEAIALHHIGQVFPDAELL